MFIPLRVCVWRFGVYIPFWVYICFCPLWPPISLLTCICTPLWVFSVRVRASPYGIFGRFEDEWSLWGFHAVSQTSEALWVFHTVSWWVTPFGIFSSFRSDGHLLSFGDHSRRLDHYLIPFWVVDVRAVASLTVPGGQEFHFPHFFLKFRSFVLIFPQTLLIFFLNLAPRVGDSSTRKGSGYATGWRRLWRLDHHVCVWPLRVFYTLLNFWRRLWCLDHYVYNWPLRVLYTLLSLSRRLWHLDHYVYVWPSRLFRPFCVFDIVSRVRPLLSSI